MTLTLYNTAARAKERFEPLTPGRVGLYVCGVTVYDLCHIGHARSALVFDVLVRYLRAKGYKVTYVRNFTDVDDKIIDRARALGKDPAELAEQYIEAFCEDMGRLRILPADQEPRATEHIPGMIRMIERLLERGHAYAAGGDVFFAVESLPSYGSLSGRRLEDMNAGSRVAVDQKKRHPADFALWKAAKPGEPQWPSPWGPGRPGWHIECSVMSSHFLGPSFDIHGGGRDLLFPHHENERAQSVAACGGDFARYWLHNGFVTVNGEKMSKSLGNFLTIRDALKQYSAEVLRLFLLSKHYRSPLDVNRKAVGDLQAGLGRVYRTLKRAAEIIGPPENRDIPPLLPPPDARSPFLATFTQLMDDDLNTAGALGSLFEKVRDINRLLRKAAPRPGPEVAEALRRERGELLLAAGTLGVLQEEPERFFEQLPGAERTPDSETIERLVAERAEARARRDWSRADEIRDRLKAQGVVLEDGPQGTTWRRDV